MGPQAEVGAAKVKEKGLPEVAPEPRWEGAAKAKKCSRGQKSRCGGSKEGKMDVKEVLKV